MYIYAFLHVEIDCAVGVQIAYLSQGFLGIRHVSKLLFTIKKCIKFITIFDKGVEI